MPVPRLMFWFLLLLAPVLLAVRNLPWHLDDYDQAKQAWTAHEAVHDGHWLHQHTPTGRNATKPPLAAWLSGGLRSLGCPWELAWRLPGLLAAGLVLGGLWWSGQKLLPESGGPLAAAAFAFNVVTPRVAGLVRTDMLLALCVVAAGLATWAALRAGRWSRWHEWTLFLALLGGCLTKGPIILAFLLPGWLIHTWSVAGSALPRAWPGRTGWLVWGAPVALFGAWVSHGVATVPGFWEDVVLREFLGRFSVGEAAVHHNGPPGTYALTLLGRWFPWSLAFLWLAAPWRRWRALWRDPATRWLLCWAFGGLLAMELVPAKRFDRIFPVLPPLCLLLVAFAARRPRARGLAPVLITAAGVACAAVTLWSVWRSERNSAGALVEFARRVRTHVPADESLVVIQGSDEGLPLYLGGTPPVKPGRAVRLWREGEGQWLLLPAALRDAHAGEFADAEEIDRSPPTPAAAAWVLLRRPQRRPVETAGEVGFQ